MGLVCMIDNNKKMTEITLKMSNEYFQKLSSIFAKEGLTIETALIAFMEWTVSNPEQATELVSRWKDEQKDCMDYPEIEVIM